MNFVNSSVMPLGENLSLRCAGLARGRRLHFTFDGRPVLACEGETIAAALLGTGQRTLRNTSRAGAPRGLFCGMGVCFDCLVRVDGRPNMRACQTPVADGMIVETQLGHGPGDAPA
jgi:predicted molibdopterin-dependent oxidoreductase YjgC